MASYSMTPYAFSAYPRNARGGERRPIDDLNGRGSSLRTILDQTLGELRGDDLIIDQTDNSKSVRVARLYPYAQFTFVEFGIGRAGFEGTLHQSDGGRVGYTADEHNESRIRGIFVFPAGGYEAFWLSERAGNFSAYSHLEQRLLRAIRAADPDLTVKLDPVADWEAVRSWSENVLVRELRFDAPRVGSSTQAMQVNGYHADVRVVVKPRGVSLNRLLASEGPDREAIYGFLSGFSPLEESQRTPESIIGNGWNAHVAFTTPAGRQRSFGVATDEAGPTLVYQIGSDPAGVPGAYRPSDQEVAATCSQFLQEINSRLPVGTSVAEDILERVV
jgi:hypothetical protein